MFCYGKLVRAKLINKAHQGSRQLLTTGGGGGGLIYEKYSIRSNTAGSGGAVSPPAGPGQNPGGSPGGKAPGSTEEPAFYTT